MRDIKIELPDREAFFKAARATVGAAAKHFPAPLKCVDCVEAAATLPFEEGMKVERDAFLMLIQTTESKALRHYFFSERAAAKIPDVPEDTPKRPIKTAAVVGAGTMGGGIAMNFANAGIPVVVLEVNQEALDKGLATVRKNYENSLKKGRLTQEKFDHRMGLILGTLSYDRIKDADIVIEAVFEELGIKEKVFRKLDEVMKPGAILATNTSTLDVNKIAAFTRQAAGCDRARTSSARRMSCGSWRSSAAKRPPRTSWPPSWRSPRRSRRSPWSRGSVTASSGTG